MTSTTLLRRIKSILPWRELKIITTPNSDSQIEHLIDETGEKRLFCDTCQGITFEVEAILNVKMIIGNKKQPLVHNLEQKKLFITNVVKCATCGDNNFVEEKASDYNT
jgi:hypothetical protein